MTYKNLGKKDKSVEYLKYAAFCGNNDAICELRNIIDYIGIDVM
jgi:hypothetical protein